ncbi:DUF1540 domain-containing protein [Butyricicoccus sp. Marseille-Q5471]|uniref:DUF1540 domain-containing protein n=1 Tax=Butyricicoccus sp. Marseille-Q5471 TaxID=3039493 RepID=UPI0024BCFF42|nr:DUF1540 domain-containing protein [Butyricicoccus sp. Marseille-Q5471]
MTNLQCSVNSCGSNKEGCCCRPSIKVAGQQAQACSDTCCHSYTPKSDAPSNSADFERPNLSLEIGCSACNCVHNDGHKCGADCVCVKNGSSGTECATFKSN